MRYEGKIYLGSIITDACIDVDDDGKIAAIKKSLDGCRKLKGFILPGAVDMHVHFREPGQTYKEDFYTGTLSAAFGGVTFVADMPNNVPPIKTPEDFENKLNAVRSKANVDFTLYTMLTSESKTMEHKNKLFKWYMYEENLNSADIPSDALITVHAELKNCIKNASSLYEYDFARPEKCERDAIRKLAEYGRKFHVAHVSSPDSLMLCSLMGHTCEVTPHHLFLHRGLNLGSFGKVNPPLRGWWVAEEMLRIFSKGAIDVIASDHAPHTVEEKEQGFENAPPGIPEVETYVPIFLYMWKLGKFDLKTMVHALMTRPAELLKIKKGKIDVGYDADLIAVNINDVRKIRASKLHYKCGWTPYEGMSGIFPHTVILRGEKVIENGELIADKTGKFSEYAP